jgi:GTPase SAR1 family protein
MAPTFDPRLVAFLQRCATAFAEWPRLQDTARGLTELAQTAPDPFRVAVVGRMKAGKSTLLNSLIGQPLAIMNVEEATATINVISHGSSEQTAQFVAVWKDGVSEPFPIEKLATDWTGKSPEVIERIKRLHHLQLFSPAEKLKEFQIIDTPGTGSSAEGHETVTREYLRPEVIDDSFAQSRKADAILYVISNVREGDAEILTLFGEGRLTAADPYNSLCVLHKWDAAASDAPHEKACRRAAHLHEQLKDKVLTVLPVSGPLGLFARHGGDEAFASLLDVLSTAEPARITHALASDKRWDRDVELQPRRPPGEVLPWASFQLLMGHYLQKPPGSVQEAREQCFALSHLAELEQLLERHFFANAMTIKQCQLLRKASDLVEPGIRYLQQLAAEESDDVERAERAAQALRDPELSRWAQRKADDARADSERVRKLALSLSEDWAKHRTKLEGLQRDLQVLRALHAEDCAFRAEHHPIIRAVCGAAVESQPTYQSVVDLIPFYRRASQSRLEFEADKVAMFGHVLGRLEKWHHTFKRLKTPLPN